jgi:hypothetical protein
MLFNETGGVIDARYVSANNDFEENSPETPQNPQ